VQEPPLEVVVEEYRVHPWQQQPLEIGVAPLEQQVRV